MTYLGPTSHEEGPPTPWRPSPRLTDAVLARILDRLLARIPIPGAVARRWSRCPFCDTYRKDPTDNCPRCGL